MSHCGGPEYYDLSQAEISKDKVVHYLLNLLHPDGKSKAKFFWAKGFNPAEWEMLADALKEQGARNPIESRTNTEFGLKIAVRCNIETPDGGNPCILSVWMHAAKGVPRLITAYPG